MYSCVAVMCSEVNHFKCKYGNLEAKIKRFLELLYQVIKSYQTFVKYAGPSILLILMLRHRWFAS